MAQQTRRWPALAQWLLVGLLLMATTACTGPGNTFPSSLAATEGPIFVEPGAPSQPTRITTETVTEESVPGITLTASAAYGGVFRAQGWTPIHVTVQNDTTDMVAQVQVAVSRDNTTYATTLELPGGARKATTVYAYIPNAARQVAVRLVRDGQRLAQQPVKLTPHSGNTYLVAVIAPDGVSLRLPDRLRQGMPLTSVALGLDELPERAAGLAMFDALILADAPTAELGHVQATALHEWVLHGGQLVISGGAGAARTLTGLPPALRPVRVGDVEARAAADLFGSADAAMGELTLARLEPLTDAVDPVYPLSSSVLNVAADPPLLLEKQVGKGVVTTVALPLDAPDLLRWVHQQVFWSELLHPRPGFAPGFGPADMRLDVFTESIVGTTLTNLPALQLPSLLTLGLLLLAYILLVGPATYLVLRLLDRQALGWVIVPALTLVFAAGAYGLGYAQRGGDVILHQVTMIEPLDGERGEPTLARVRSFAGIFSPTQAPYALDATPSGATGTAPLLRPLSLQGPWDPTVTAQGGVFVQEQTGAAAARASDLEIAQWSMRAVLADEVRPAPAIRARLTLAGDQISGEVSNASDELLRDVVLVQGGRVAHLGDIAPGTSLSATLTLRAVGQPIEHAPISSLIYGEQLNRFHSPQTGSPPPELLARVRLLDALYSSGPMMRGPQPLLFAWTERTPLEMHIPDKRIARQEVTLITFSPRLEVAGETVALGQGWLERQIEQPAEGLCVGGSGVGVNLFAGPEAVLSLKLPHALAQLQPAELTLITSTDGMNWPPELSLELFDWQSNSWIAQERTDRTIAVAQPARFLGSDGVLRVRVAGSLTPQNNPGCIYVDATLKGALP